MTQHFVIDPSALMQAYIKDVHTLNAKALLSSLEADEPPELHLLEIGLAESANVLWKHEVIFKDVTQEFVHQTINNLRAIPLHLHLVESYLDEAINVGRNHHLAIYDALYIALVRELDVPFITADKKQEAVARLMGVTIKPLAEFVATS